MSLSDTAVQPCIRLPRIDDDDDRRRTAWCRPVWPRSRTDALGVHAAHTARAVYFRTRPRLNIVQRFWPRIPTFFRNAISLRAVCDAVMFRYDRRAWAAYKYENM